VYWQIGLKIKVEEFSNKTKDNDYIVKTKLDEKDREVQILHSVVETRTIRHKDKTDEQQLEWRKDKVQELNSQGNSQREIARFLK
jgi:hypothetical protein